VLSVFFERWAFWVFVFLFFCLFLFSIFIKKRKSFRYEKIPSLFTKSELKFLRVLDASVGKEFRVFGKIRIADVLKPQKGLNKKTWAQNFWRIANKHFDYVLCDTKTLSPVCAIELNDKSHDRADRKKRDVDVSMICKSANFPIVWISLSSSYSQKELRNTILKEISKTNSR